MADTKSILVVDDEPHLVDLVHDNLEDFGYEPVWTASNGLEGIKKMLEFAEKEGRTFDLIISDWDMPEMNGMELIKKVRQTPSIAEIPFLFMTGRGDERIVADAIQEGVDDFMFKPFTAEELEEKLNEIFSIACE